MIGAAKCGTTSLHHYLGRHPEVFMSRRKELNFFTREDWPARVDWYRSRFRAEAAVRGESSPGYSMDPVLPGVAERIHRLLPEARLVYLVGDPIERLIAHYVEHRSLGFERRSLPAALADAEEPANPYVCASRYATQLEHYLRWFPEDRLLVMDQDELRGSRRQALERVFSFLGVDPSFAAHVQELALNPRGAKRQLRPMGQRLLDYGLLRPVPRLPGPLKRGLVRMLSRKLETPPLSPELRARLEETLAPEAERLRARTGMSLESWSV